MTFVCTRCERRYRERVQRCLTCGGHVRAVSSVIRPAMMLAFVGLSCVGAPPSVDIPHCEKLVGVTFRSSELLFLTRSMRPREVPESYSLYTHSPFEDAVAYRLTERCP